MNESEMNLNENNLPKQDIETAGADSTETEPVVTDMVESDVAESDVAETGGAEADKAEATKISTEVAAESTPKASVKKKRFRLSFVAKLVVSLCTSLFTSLTLMFFSPLEIHLGNINEFSFGIGDSLPRLLLFCLGISVVISIIESILPTVLCMVCNAFSFGLGLCLYVQANFLNFKMGTLTGEGDVYDTKTVIFDIAAWAFIFAAVIVAYVITRSKKKTVLYKNAIIFVSLALILMQTAALVTSIVNIGDEHPDYDQSVYLGINNEFTLSEKNNVVVFIVDTCDDRYYDETVRQYPEITERLKGFTYYPNMISTHSRTYPSVPYLLTDRMCYFDKTCQNFVNDAAADSTFIPDLKNKCGADIGVFTDLQYIGKSLYDDIDNCCVYGDGKNIPISTFSMLKQMLKISLYRDAPYFAKSRFSYNIDTVNDTVVQYPEKCIEQKDAEFYAKLSTDGLTATGNYDTAFRFYHFWGAHPGADFDENLVKGNSKGVYAALCGNFNIIGNYVDEMKRLGIFENSTIIITADHGSSEGTSADKPLEITAPPCPVLLIKPAGVGADAAYGTSAAPVSHADLFATIISAAGGDSAAYGSTVYDFDENSVRDRYYYNSALYSDEDGEVALREYLINGDARSMENWKLTGKNWDIVYSERSVSKRRLSEILK